MSVEKAPYVNYTEVTSYQEDINNGSEIPVFIVKTNNNVNVADITPSNVLRFISYRKFKNYFSISDEESLYNDLDKSIKDLDALVKDYFTENSMYGMNDEYGLTVPYIYMVDVGNSPTINHYKKALEVSEMKRKSTVALFPNTEDIEFMKEVKNKIMEETKDGLLRIGYFAVSGQGELMKEFSVGDVIKPTFNHHGYLDIVEGYLKTENDAPENFYETQDFSANGLIARNKLYVYYDLTGNKYYKYNGTGFSETTLDNLAGYSEVIEAYKDGNKFYEDSAHETEITSPDETAIYLNKSTYSNVEAYTYVDSAFVKINVVFTKDKLVYDDETDYGFFVPSTTKRFGGSDETFDQYCARLQYTSQQVQSSRIAIVDKKHFGKTIARICSTPYFLEPGYLPYMSVTLGTFDERSKDDRDSLFDTGLIFNEDDYTLSNPTPRMCLATSTAWGVEDHDMRTTDALLHARRNVDYHIRRILNIIAPQLKRNETSVSIRGVKNSIDVYLDSELNRGTIQAYSFDVVESSYNPYALLIKGRITPVNSTLAIEFENTVGSPYTIASDYV